LLAHPQELHENLQPALGLDIRLLGLLLPNAEGLPGEASVRLARPLA